MTAQEEATSRASSVGLASDLDDRKLKVTKGIPKGGEVFLRLWGGDKVVMMEPRLAWNLQ